MPSSARDAGPDVSASARSAPFWKLAFEVTAWISLLSLLLLATPPALAQTTQEPLGSRNAPLLHACVEMPTDLQARAKGSSALPRLIAADGVVHVVELQGDYGRGQLEQRTDLSRAVLDGIGVDVDFLVVFTDFEFATGNALAFYNPVRNDVQGIGLPIQDRSAMFGSRGRLQGYVDMASMSRYSFNPHEPAFQSSLNTLAHELMHRWGVAGRYQTSTGALSSDLLGREGSHWSLLADTSASIMYGARWMPLAASEFQISEARQRLSRWDLYLAGLVSAAEVPPLQLLRGTGLDPTALPEIGLRAQATIETVHIQQLIAAEGERVPSSAEAQRAFTAALVLVARPDQIPDPQKLAQLRRFASRFENYFQSIVEGRASLRFHREGLAHARSGVPVPLSGSPLYQHPDPVGAGIAWLKSRQQASGGFSDRAHSAVRDTAAAVEAIRQVDPGWPGAASALQYLSAQIPSNQDEALRRAAATRAAEPSGMSPTLALMRDWVPAGFDVALAAAIGVRAELFPDLSNPDLFARLLQLQISDGSFATVERGPARLRATVLGARALFVRWPQGSSAADRAREWLMSTLLATPLQGAQSASTSELAEALEVAAELRFPETLKLRLRQALEARQGEAGDWEGSVHTTASASLALARLGQPNLQVVAVAHLPLRPVRGEPVLLRARVRNSGGSETPASRLRWTRVAEGASTGAPVAPDQTVPSLFPGEAQWLHLPVETGGLASATLLRVEVDPDDELIELAEADNVADLRLELHEPSASVDLALWAQDQSLTPPSYQRLGEAVELRGLVRNLGTVAAAQTVLRLERVLSGQRLVLAETVVDVGALAQTPYVLQFQTREAGDYVLELNVDPDQGSGDLRRDNNHARLSLVQEDGVDFALDQNSLVVSPEPPLVGVDTSIRVALSNLGSRDPGPTIIEVRSLRASETQVVQRRSLQVEGAGRAELEFNWRPEAEGEHRLELIVDPDGLIEEIDETNNRVVRNVAVLRADGTDLTVLAGSTRAIPARPLQGRPLRIESTLLNQGQTPASGFSAAVYLGDPRAGGVRLAGKGGLSLEPGQSEPVIIQVPAFPSRGEASIFVQVDSELEVAETNEANNLGVIDTIALSAPDLGLGAQEVEVEPPYPQAGLQAQVRARISNRGEQASDPVFVHLLGLYAGEVRLIGEPIEVPALAPGDVRELDWEWLVEDAPLDALRFQIDPERSAADGDRSNNEVDLPLLSSVGGSVALVPYFSPNGDGVRDRASVLFPTAPFAPGHVDVIAANGELVVRLQNFQQLPGERVQMQWDGFDARGGLAEDGAYQLIAYGEDHHRIGAVWVVLDTDRVMALDSVNSGNVSSRRLPASANAWQAPPAGSVAEDYLYIAGESSNPSGALKRGIIRTHALLGGLEPVLSSTWLERNAGGASVRSLLIEPQLGNELVFLIGNAVWTQGIDTLDRPQLIAPLPAGAGQAVLLGHASMRRVLLLDHGGNALWLLDLDTGSFQALASPNGAREPIRIYPSGILLGSDERIEGGALPVRFVPFDGAFPAVELSPPFRPGYDCFARAQPLTTAARVLFHVLGSDGERVELIELDTGQSRTLFETTESSCPGGSPARASKQSSTVLGYSLARAQWIEALERIVVVEHRNQRLRLLNAAGDVLGTHPIPGSLRGRAYGDLGGIPAGASARGEPIGPNFLCPQRLLPDWQLLAEREQLGRSAYDPRNRSLYFASGEMVLDDEPGDLEPGYSHGFICEGATDYFKLALDSGEISRVAAHTGWPLEDASDRASYPPAPALTEGVRLPSGWPRFIQRGGPQLRADARIVGSEGLLGRAWPLATSLLASIHGESRLLLADASEPARLSRVISSLDRLRAELRASSNGRTVTFTGLATDAHLDYYQIDYAQADSPDHWFNLLPPRREQVRADEFMTWAPPQSGAYLFRLRVQDLAGNRVESYASAELVFSSPLSNVRIDHRAISPNGDGNKDRARLDFLVTRPTELGLRVLDASGSTVFSADRVFGADALGEQQWGWNGLDGSGSSVADGDYRIELTAGFAFPLGVDTSVPLLASAGLSPSYPPERPSFAKFEGASDLRGARDTSADLQVLLERRASADSAWSRIEAQPTTNSGPRSKSGTIPLSWLQLFEARYRWVAEDQAGNRVVLELGDVERALVLVGVDSPLLPDPTSWAPADAVPSVLADVPKHRASGSALATSVLPENGAQVFFLADHDDIRPVVVDVARSVGTANPSVATLQWQTVSQGRPTLLGDGFFAIAADVSGLELNESFALRIRETESPQTRTSNSFRFNTPELILEGCASGAEIVLHARLPGRPTEVRLEATWQGGIRAPVSVEGAPGAESKWVFTGVPDLTGAAIELSVRYSHRPLPWKTPIQLPACSGGGGSTGGVAPGSLSLRPVSSGTCGSTPSFTVVAAIALPTNSVGFRLELLDPGAATPRLIAAGPGSAVDINGYQIDTRGLPGFEGRLRLSVEAPAGQWSRTEEGFPIDHSAPEIGFSAPSPGSRVCAIEGALSGVDAYFNTDSRGLHLLEAASLSSASPRYVPLRCNGGPNGGACAGLDDPSGLVSSVLSARSTSRRLLALPDPQVPDGSVSFRLRATDWSGAQVCAVSTVFVDASVELDPSSEPEPRSTDGIPLIAPAGAPDYRVARWFYRAREPLQLRAELHATVATGAPGSQGYRIDGPSLATLRSGTLPSGEFPLEWDGRIQGQIAADGMYAISVSASDDCGHSRTFSVLVRVDSTAPLLTLSEPLPEVELRSSSVQSVGSVVDAHPDSYQLAFSSQGPQGPWQEFGAGQGNVMVPRVLGVAQASGHRGEAWIRLSASDRLGNASELVRRFRLAARTELLSSARLSRTLISPNGDGRLDNLDLRLVLARQAELSVDLLGADGQVLMRLLDAVPAPAGPFVLPWGQDFDPTLTPEGSYRFAISALEAGAGAEPDLATLDFAIDLTEPSLQWTPTSLTHLNCESAAELNVDDAHLAELQVELRSVEGAVVRRVSGLATGVYEFADFEHLAEGEYRLWAEAIDLAGNGSERESAFVLDCSPPELALEVPEEGAVLARAAAPAHRVEGRVADAHPHSFTLERSSIEQPHARELLFSQQGAAPQGFAREWLAEAADGDHWLHLGARDQAGNSHEQSIRIRVDGTPPLAEIFDPTEGTTLRERFQLGVIATDLNFSELQLLIASPQQAARGEWSRLYRSTQAIDHGYLPLLDSPELGERVLRLEVTDQAGLKSHFERRVRLDGVPPPTPLDLAASIESGGNIRLNWRGGESEDLHGFKIYRRAGATPLPLNSQPLAERQYLDRDVADGEWIYEVSAVDLAGNESARSAPVRVRMDRTPPEASIAQPNNGERVRGLLTVRGTAASNEDFERYELALLDAQGNPLRVLREQRLPQRNASLGVWDTRQHPEGMHASLRLRAWDQSGNLAEARVPVQVDNLAPAAPEGLTGVETGDDLELSWQPNSEPDLLGYLLYRNGRLLSGGTVLPADLRPLANPQNQQIDPGVPDGELSYRVYAIDTAGNLSAPSQPFSVLRDQGPPSAQLVRPDEGEVFDQALEVLASTEHLDVASITFAYRELGASQWLPIGEPVLSPPWRQVLDPSGLAFGDYEIRALATDHGGRADPQPPQVQVRHDDVSAPAPPLGLTARANGATVELTWAANSEPDLDSYRLQRLESALGWIDIALPAAQATSAQDLDREIGTHRYRVFALDASGNESAASIEAEAVVFAIELSELPATPTLVEAIRVRGSSPRQGELRLQRRVDGVVADLGTQPLLNPQAFETPATLLPGLNLITAAVVDAQANQSLAAQFATTRGLLPQAPVGLQGTVVDREVSVSWLTAAGGDPLAGYRLYRNGSPALADAVLQQTIAATDAAAGVPQVLDADPTTAWREQPAGLSDRLQRRLELRWPQAVLVGSVQLQWSSEATSARDFDLYGWFDERWNRLAEVRNQSGAEYRLELAIAYPTQALRIVPTRTQWPGAQHSLAEVSVLTRSLVTESSLNELVADGVHRYEVAAVSLLGFEGPRSETWVAEVGDSTPPPAVLLSGALSGRDAQLSWTESQAPDLRRYRLQRDGQLLAQVDASAARSYLDRGLSNGTHRYRIAAEDAVGNLSEWSNTIELEVLGSAPGAPVITAARSQPDAPALELHWIAGEAANAVRYRLFASQQADDPSEPYREIARPLQSPWLHTGLQYGQRLYYRVQAEDAFGNLSPFSAPFAAEVRDLSTPAAPALTWPRFAPASIEWREPRYLVCGQAAADQRVEVRVNDRARTSVHSEPLSRLLPAVSTPTTAPMELVLSPDGGRMAWRDDLGALHERDFARGLTQAVPLWHLSQLRYSANGRTLHGWSSGIGQVLAWDEAEGQRLLHFGMDTVERAIDLDARRWLVAGTRQGEHGLWLIEPALGSALQIDYPDSETVRALLPHPALPLVYLWAESGRVRRLDIESLQLEELPAPAEAADMAADPQADGLIALARGSQGDQLLRLTRAGTEVALQNVGSIEAFVLEPSGSGAWLLSSDGLRLHRWGSTEAETALPLTSTPDAYVLVGSAGGTLAAFAPGVLSPIQPIRVAGSFCTGAIGAEHGLNRIDAVAENASGVRSQASAALELRFDGTVALAPDLAIDAADVRLLPEPGLPGQPHSLVVHLSNLGSLDAHDFQVELELRDPLGQTRRFQRTESLGPNAASIWVLPLGLLTAEGDYQVEVFLDRGDRIAESNELNNHAQRRITLRAGAGPWMRLSAAATQQAPGREFAGEVTLVTATPFSGVVELRIEDPAGALVATLPSFNIEPLAISATWSRGWNWLPPAGLLAGPYVLHARLSDAQGQLIVDERLTLLIEAQLQTQLVLQPSASEAQVGQDLAVNFGFDVPSSNTLVEGAQLALSVRRAAGPAQTLWSGSAGTLSAGTRLRRSLSWRTAGLEPGPYELSLELSAPGLQRQLLRQVLLISAASQPQLGGTLALQPSPVWALGQATALDYRASNSGTAALSAQSLRVRILSEPGRVELLADQRTVDLAPAQTQSFELDLGALPPAPGQYLAVLEALTDGSWRTLAQLGLQSTDVEPPMIELLAPLAETPVRMPAAMEVEIRDRHSQVERAEFSVDGGAWRTLPGAGNRFGSVLSGLADGEHMLSVRARDSWLNQRTAPPRRIVVDSTAPAIQISGVVDGGLYNHAVNPAFEAQDVHLVSVRGWSNGQPHSSGAAIALEGQYRLEVHALDAAGNRALQSLQFRLDLTAPTLQISTPQDGSQVAAATIPVEVLTEPLATVTLATGAWQAQAPADPQGRATFASVPLQLGANRIEAVARDQAGNASEQAAVNVQRVESNGELSGDLLLEAPTHPRATPMTLRAEVRNGTLEAIDGELIVSVRSAAGDLLEQRRQPLQLAAGAAQSWSAVLATDTWPLGAMLAQLHVDTGGSSQQLSAVGFDLVDQQPPLVQLLQPQAGSLTAGTLTLEVQAGDDDALAEVSYRLDQGNWITLAPSQAPGVFVAALDLADGLHTVQAQARDRSGNLASTAPRSFTVDSTPPEIVVEGVIQQGAYGEPVRPLVRLIEAHPGQLETLLDGAPFESGALIDRSGRFVLTVAATDLAGNTAQARVEFEVDLEPVGLELLAPAEGALLTSTRTDVLGRTKPGARVSVQGRLSSHQITADAEGLFRVQAVELEAGSNRLTAQATDAFGRSSPELTRTVFVDTNGNQGLSGELEAGVEIGVDAAWGVRVILREGLGLARANVDARLVLERNGASIGEQTWSTALPALSMQSRELALPPQAELGLVRLRLQVRLEGAWVDLSEASLPVVDRTAPSAAFVLPAPDGYHRGDIEVRADAQDAHSGIAFVEVRERSGAWVRLLRVDGGSLWSGLLRARDEGPLWIELRAVDQANNASVIAGRAVHVDRSPPRIEVSGISPAGLYAQPVQIGIDVTDASPLETTILLDGQPFVSAQWVQAHGPHRLQVSARDAAGNVSSRDISFELDLEAPSVQVMAPLSGAVIRADATSVLGLTEPLAEVRMLLNGSERRQSANASGQFRFDGVPLRIGLNSLRLHAIDRAGNVGEPSTVVVERRGGFALRGDLTMPPETVVGSPLPIDLQIWNDAAHAQPLVRLQLLALDSGGQRHLLDDRRHDFAAGERLSLSLAPDNSAWAVGPVSIQLLATDEIQVQLAAASLQLRPRGPNLPPPLPRPVQIPASGLAALTLLGLLLAALGAAQLQRMRVRR